MHKKHKRLIALLLGISVCMTQLLGSSGLTYAAETKEEQGEQEPANSFRYKNGELLPEPGTMLRGASYKYAWKKVNGTYRNSVGQSISGAVARGIDVSHHNGNIDWAKVKKDDISYAIIRCGYGQNYTSQDDKKWRTNANACTKYGIPFGTYLYSYATSKTAAIGEANHVLRLIKGYNLRYPVYFDMEDAKQRGLSSSKLAEIAKAFCDTIEKAGYEAAIYANYDWFTNKLTHSYFNSKDRWVARYNTYCGLKKTYNMWQSTSTARVSGISGNVDMNFRIGSKPMAQVKKVSISKTSYSLSKGKSIKLSASASPKNAYSRSIGWKSSNTKVATVSSSGTVKGVGSGTATITAYAKDGCGAKATCKITVKGSSVAVSSVKMSKTSYRMTHGSSSYLKATVYPSNASSRSVKWSSSSSCVKVSSSGKISAYAPGKATITAASTSGGKKAYCTVYAQPKAVPSLSYSTSGSKVQLKWSRVSGASGYGIYRYDTRTKKNIRIATARSTSSTYSFYRINGSSGSYLSTSSSYVYRVYPYKSISGKNYYASGKSVTVSFKPKSTSVSSVKRVSSTKAKLYWKKVSGAAGFVIYYSTSKNGGYKAARTVSSKTTSYTKTSLKKGKTYYFKVCAYKKAGGRTLYSNYSNIKSIKMK